MVLTLSLASLTYRPRETVKGDLVWHDEQTARDVGVRLFWRTAGRGEEDLEIAAETRHSEIGPNGQISFQLDLPEGPYTFSGRLISLIWAVEAVLYPSQRCARQEIIVSPTGREILLQKLSDETPG